LVSLVVSYLVGLALSLLLAGVYLLRRKLGLTPLLLLLGACFLAAFSTYTEGLVVLGSDKLEVNSTLLAFLPAMLAGLLLLLAQERPEITQQTAVGLLILAAVMIAGDWYLALMDFNTGTPLADAVNVPGQALGFSLLAIMVSMAFTASALDALLKVRVLALALAGAVGTSVGALAMEGASAWFQSKPFHPLTLAFAALAGFLCSGLASLWVTSYQRGRFSPLPSLQQLLDWRLQVRARLEGLVIDSQRQSTVSELVEEGVALTTLSGTLLYANEPFLRLFECEAKEIQGKKITELVGEAWQETFERALVSLISGQTERASFMIQLETPSGESKWLDMRVAVTTNERSLPTYGLWLAEDATRRQQLNLQLIQANRELNLVADFINLLLPVQGNRQLLSRAVGVVTRLLNGTTGGFYRVDWLEGKLELEYDNVNKIGDLVPEEVRTLRLGQGFSGWVAATGTPVIINDVATHPRTVTPLLISNGVRSYAGIPCVFAGKCQGVLFVLSDKPNAFKQVSLSVLQRLGALMGPLLDLADRLDGLHNQLARLQSLLSHSPHGLMSLDAKGHIIFCSGKLAALFGLEPNQLEGLNLEDFHDSALGEVLLQLNEKVLKQNRTLTADYETAEGEQWKLVCMPSRAPGEAASSQVMAIPKASASLPLLPAELENLQRLAVLGLFAAGVAHDTNNLLGPLQLRLELLQRELEEATVVEDVNEALECVRELSELSKRLVKLARSRELVLQPVELAEVVENARSLFSTEARHRQVQVKVELPDGLPEVEAEPALLEEVILNLASNALDAMPDGGELRLSAEALDDHVVVKLEDTGVGIPKQHLASILEPHFTTKGENGTGLGLFVAQNLVRQMGGSLEVESEEGKGTLVRLMLKQAGPAS